MNAEELIRNAHSRNYVDMHAIDYSDKAVYDLIGTGKMRRYFPA